MAVQIDGRIPPLDTTDIEQFRQTSTSYFTVGLPADNVLGVTPVENYDQCLSAGVSCASQWTQDGFYLTLDDLSVGTHLLHFQAESGAFSLDVTDTLNVVVPEPYTWAMMLLGFVGLGLADYRASRKSAAITA